MHISSKSKYDDNIFGNLHAVSFRSTDSFPEMEGGDKHPRPPSFSLALLVLSRVLTVAGRRVGFSIITLGETTRPIEK